MVYNFKKTLVRFLATCFCYSKNWHIMPAHPAAAAPEPPALL